MQLVKVSDVKDCFWLATLLDPVIDKHSDTLLELADKIPIVEAEPVRHGRWEKVKQDLGDGIKTYRFGCSECGYLKNTLTGNYCPNCGAKMDLEE